MSIWNILKEALSGVQEEHFTSRLHEKLTKSFPDRDENFHVKAACLSGLMARIAFTDMKIDEKEKVLIKSSLEKWMDMSEVEATVLSQLCLDEVKDLCGIENHLYCLPLRESLEVSERYQIIVTLFAIAAADGSVDNSESEEIRNINTALLLEPKHFTAARATVLEYLASLKGS